MVLFFLHIASASFGEAGNSQERKYILQLDLIYHLRIAKIFQSCTETIKA